MPDKRTVDELTIEELEQVLRIRKREARLERLRHLEEVGRRQPGDAPATRRPSPDAEEVGYESFLAEDEAPSEPKEERSGQDMLLLGIEIIAVVGIVVILVFAALELRSLNDEAADEQGEIVETIDLPTPTATPIISAVVLPGGHRVVMEDGERRAEPNYDEVPAALRPLVEQQFAGPAIVPTPSPAHALRVRIPAIRVDAPVVQGDGAEQLKRGIGQHIGTANPGERGNMVLSAHNDVYGQIFRHLDQLSPGDEIIVSTQVREYRYVVQYARVVEPTEVSVMAPTAEPVVTLISCYPYLINNKRYIIVAELQS
ncbi:MAG: class D sortase [Chloroflexi bacterium]|nr:class D sortase [Chloroflexota bacterium]